MRLSLIFSPFLLIFGLVACDNGAKQAPGGDKKGATADGDDGGDSSGPVGDGDFDGWCAKASEVDRITGDLGEYFGKFCNDGKATSLLKSTLVNAAYSGSGSPKLKSIEKMSSDKAAKETTAYFAVGIKLPISAQDHFDKVGPKGGDEASAKRLAKASNAKSTKFEVLDKFKEDGKFHVRGWRIHSVNSQSTGGIDIETDTVARSDQYQLEKGSLYAYTQITEKGTKTVKSFDMLTAGIQVGDSGYLLTIAHLTVDDRGLDKVAASKIRDTANALVAAMYAAAEEASGGGGAELRDPESESADNLRE